MRAGEKSFQINGRCNRRAEGFNESARGEKDRCAWRRCLPSTANAKNPLDHRREGRDAWNLNPSPVKTIGKNRGEPIPHRIPRLNFDSFTLVETHCVVDFEPKMHSSHKLDQNFEKRAS